MTNFELATLMRYPRAPFNSLLYKWGVSRFWIYQDTPTRFRDSEGRRLTKPYFR